MVMKKVVNLEKESLNSFYKKINWLKILKLFKADIIVSYHGKEYSSSNKKHPNEIDEILKIVDILNSNSRNEKYSFIYDYSCEYLDNEFISKQLCNFKNDMCECNRNKPRCKQVSSCCESLKKKKICEYFDNNKKACKIKSITCKLFACRYLNKNSFFQ